MFTLYLIKLWIQSWTTLLISAACGITDEDDNSYIITGGDYSYATVSKYNINGGIEYLPNLNYGREQHGCGTYLDSNNDRVS